MCLRVSPPNLTQETDPFSETFIQFITVHNYQIALERCHAISMRQGRTVTKKIMGVYNSLRQKGFYIKVF